MNIALINQFYYPSSAPTGLLLHDLAGALVQRGHRVTVLTSPAQYGAADPASGAGSPIRVLRLGPSGRHARTLLGKARDYLLFHARVNAALARMDPAPDRIVCQTTPPFVGLAAARARRRRGVPYLLWCMDLYPEALAAHGLGSPGGPLLAPLRWLARRERSAASCVVTLGSDMSELVRRTTLARIEEVPVWSDLHPDDEAQRDAASLRRERGWAADETVLLYSGNMGRAHRADEFARLAMLLRDRSIRCRFVFCGDGPRKAAWQQRWGELFEFVEQAPRERLAAHLLSADVHLVSQEAAWRGVVVPSKFQAACALGRPVVFAGPSDGAVAQWIEDSGCGWVLPPGDAAAIASAAAGVAEASQRLERGRRGAELAKSRFDRRIALDRLARVVEALDPS